MVEEEGAGHVGRYHVDLDEGAYEEHRAGREHEMRGQCFAITQQAKQMASHDTREQASKSRSLPGLSRCLPPDAT